MSHPCPGFLRLCHHAATAFGGSVCCSAHHASCLGGFRVLEDPKPCFLADGCSPNTSWLHCACLQYVISCRQLSGIPGVNFAVGCVTWYLSQSEVLTVRCMFL